jgi:hypothetical protein
MPIPAITITPAEYTGGGEAAPYPINQFSQRCLAQGDSWFSIGAFPPHLTTNVLFSLKLAADTCIVNCAAPGKLLRRMTDTTSSTTFLQILNGALAMKFDGILLSGGGNDLIEALLSTDADPAKRLLRVQAEWGPPALGAARYVSNAGWAVFQDHLDIVFALFIAERDKGVNQNVPVIFHTYDLAAPRASGAGFGQGPWLSKALTHFGVPMADWNAVSLEFYGRLRILLGSLLQKHANVHLVDTLGTLTPAPNQMQGPTADWQNEIHPTRSGYKQLSTLWAPVLDNVL